MIAGRVLGIPAREARQIPMLDYNRAVMIWFAEEEARRWHEARVMGIG